MTKSYKGLTGWLNKAASVTGHPILFVGLVVLIAAWFVAGIFFSYDEVWYNIMDVFIFLTTFFLVFIVQTSQNADTRAMQDKLDEIIDSLSNTDKKKEGEEKELKTGEKR